MAVIVTVFDSYLLQGEKLSSDSTEGSYLRKSCNRENLTLNNLYNCDETGLKYRMLPDKECRWNEDTETPYNSNGMF